MTEASNFCHTNGITLQQLKVMRWGEYLEMSLANLIVQKQKSKAND